MMNPSAIFGKEFNSILTGCSYGVFRKCGAGLPAGYSTVKFGTPFAEDSCRNLIVSTADGKIGFWDHETNDLTVIASSWEVFVKGCVEPKEVKLKPGQVKSVWVDPAFAKKMGIKVPPDA